MRNRRILITGIAGTIGSELARQLAPLNKVYGLDINESGLFDLVEELKQLGCRIWGRVGDIKDDMTVRDVFSDFKPQVVFHAAAYKHVPLMEYTPLEAIKTNILGTHNLIDFSRRYEVGKFVFISTDKAINTENIMGGTKRLGEIMVKNQGKGFVVVRFGNVLGSRGSVIPLWQRQINQGLPVTVTSDKMTRYFMTIEEACGLVIKAAEMGKGGEIFILDMKEQVNILDLAKEIVKASGRETPIKIIGPRPGEKLIEELMTIEERGRAIKKDNFWIIK